jgi:hypothetical protein
MADYVEPEFVRFINKERQANRLPTSLKQLKEGDLSHPVNLDPKRVSEFLRVAAKRAVGLFRPTRHTEVVWTHGDSELAINLVGLDVKLSDGLITMLIPVRCDQTGDATIEVAFAVGTAKEPAGLFASAYRRPNGPPLIVEAWGENLVAFAWQCLLGMISGIAGATGKDARGNVLVPVELSASPKGIQIVPMARYRFAGSSRLTSTTKTRGEQ